MTSPESAKEIYLKELRLKIDAIDQGLVQLFGQRAACIREAAEIKKQNHIPARIPDRVEEVVANVRRRAVEEGADPDLVERLWRQVIEWSIAYEETYLSK